ncbi:hypothetical protein [Dyella amyloliquefaciens]|uniref:hypothetical protein n=1 Tax=Dyella amyloliquefaciens TaxID=1770545 RepID=UPI00102E8E9F|nr:hypothetical protein [Dyella amyloliquefaciens]
MARKMSLEREREFDELRAYLGFYATCMLGIDPASATHPINELARIVEDFGRSRALEGLRQAANDTIEDAARFSPAEMEAIDGKFRSAGVVTVSEIRRRYSKSLRRIVERGIIRNETEYYLVNGVIVDQSNGTSGGEREVLQRLLDTCETRP